MGVGWDRDADRPSNDADVSSTPGTTHSDGRLQNPGDLWHEMRTDSLAVARRPVL